MSDEKEFGLTNEGTDGVTQVPVEKKDITILAEEAKKLQDKIAANQERFATESVIPVGKKKRGRPAKQAAAVEEVKPEKIWYCSTCRETIADSNAMKIGAGENRYAVFCPQCQRSFGFEDKVMLDIVADLIKNNPTGKDDKKASA